MRNGRVWSCVRLFYSDDDRLRKDGFDDWSRISQRLTPDVIVQSITEKHSLFFVWSFIIKKKTGRVDQDTILQ